ncbi:MAG: GFA family protein [Nibricoccus sp.]
MIKTPFTGGCVCGFVHYECSAAPYQIQMFRCHCRDCQHVTGGGHTPVVYVPASTFKITHGTLRYFKTDSEFMGAHSHQRGFCPECGSRITGGEGPSSTGIGMTAGSLDDPSVFKPQAEIWVSDAQPWDLMDAAAPKFEKLPPG